MFEKKEKKKKILYAVYIRFATAEQVNLERKKRNKEKESKLSAH